MPDLRRAALLLIISMLVVYALMAYQLRQQLAAGYSDFISAYTAAKILQQGDAARLYDLPLQHEIQQNAAPTVARRASALPFVRPPFEAWLFRPLAHFSYQVAFWIWTSSNLIFLTLAGALLRREVLWLKSVPLVICILAAVSFFPVFLALIEGQDSILLLLIYSLSYTCLRHDRPQWAGAIFALGTFKFPLVLPFLIPFLVRGRLRFLAGFACTATALALVSIATVGPGEMRHYISYLSTIDKLAPAVNIPRDMPNLRGLLALFARPEASLAGTVLLLLASVLVLVMTCVAWKANADAAALPGGFSLTLLSTLLVSYHAHVFDLVLLVIPICLGVDWILARSTNRRNWRSLLAWSVGLLSFSPTYMVFLFALRAGGLICIPLLLFAFGWIRVLRRGRGDSKSDCERLKSDTADNRSHNFMVLVEHHKIRCGTNLEFAFPGQPRRLCGIRARRS